MSTATKPTRVEDLDPAVFDPDQRYPIRDYVAAGVASDITFRRHVRTGALPREYDAQGRLHFYPAEVMRALNPTQNPTDDELEAWVQAKAAEAPPMTPQQAELVGRVMGSALRQRVAERVGGTA